MRAGVRADHVAATSKIADLAGVQKTWLADPIRRNKEVTAPAVLLQRRRNPIVKADAAIVERHEHARIGVSDGVQMALKLIGVEFVDVGLGAGKAAGLEVIGRHNVVIEQRNAIHTTTRFSSLAPLTGCGFESISNQGWARYARSI